MRYTVYCAGPANDSGFQMGFLIKQEMFNQAELIADSLAVIHGAGIKSFVYDNEAKIYGIYGDNVGWSGELTP